MAVNRGTCCACLVKGAQVKDYMKVTQLEY